MFGFSNSRHDQDTQHELTLEIEILKDLSPTDSQADAVKGGQTTYNDGADCGCQTM